MDVGLPESGTHARSAEDVLKRAGDAVCLMRRGANAAMTNAAHGTSVWREEWELTWSLKWRERVFFVARDRGWFWIYIRSSQWQRRIKADDRMVFVWLSGIVVASIIWLHLYHLTNNVMLFPTVGCVGANVFDSDIIIHLMVIFYVSSVYIANAEMTALSPIRRTAPRVSSKF